MHTSAKELAATIPTAFTLGVATAAFQIEGALDEDGRGPAGWDVFAAKPGAIVEAIARRWRATTTTGCPRTLPS